MKIQIVVRLFGGFDAYTGVQSGVLLKSICNKKGLKVNLWKNVQKKG